MQGSKSPGRFGFVLIATARYMNAFPTPTKRSLASTPGSDIDSQGSECQAVHSLRTVKHGDFVCYTYYEARSLKCHPQSTRDQAPWSRLATQCRTETERLSSKYRPHSDTGSLKLESLSMDADPGQVRLHVNWFCATPPAVMIMLHGNEFVFPMTRRPVDRSWGLSLPVDFIMKTVHSSCTESSWYSYYSIVRTVYLPE